MRILIATPLYPPDIGGPATYSAILARELPRRDITVSVVNFGDVRWLPRGIRHAAYFFKCLFHGARADIIYAQDPFSVGFPAMLAAKLLRKKFALKVVGDYAWEIFQGGAGIFVSLDDFAKNRYDVLTEIRRRVEHRVARSAHAVVTPSAYLKRLVSGWGVPESRIRVVYNAFRGAASVLNRDAARSKFAMRGTAIFSAGRLVPWKGFATLINVMPDIVRAHADAMLFIAGDGEEREALELRIKASGMENHVKLVGRLAHVELLEYLRAADLFVLNTGYEGFSHQILEALAFGIPVITTAIGGNPEIIRDGENGLLVNYDDREALKKAVLRLLGGDALRAEFSRRGPETAQNFTEERMLGELVALLKKI